jgi:hypothetical protein
VLSLFGPSPVELATRSYCLISEWIPLCHLLQLTELQWKYSNPPPHGLAHILVKEKVQKPYTGFVDYNLYGKISVLLTIPVFLCYEMVSEAAWRLHHLFIFTLLFVGVPPVVRPEDDVACETLPSEIHIIKGQFSADDKYITSNIIKKCHN